MKYISLTLFLLLPFGAAFSQLKPLTLEESVIGQYRQFYPEQKAVVWIPETDTYAYIENEAWYLANPANKALPQLAISLADFNKKRETISPVYQKRNGPNWGFYNIQ